MNTNFNYWLRWISLLPCAFIAYTITFLGINLIAGLSVKFGDTPYWYAKYVIPFISIAFSSYTFLEVSVKIAPNYKRKTAVALLILMILVAGGGLVFNTFGKFHLKYIENFGMAVGVFVGYFKNTEEQKNDV